MIDCYWHLAEIIDPCLGGRSALWVSGACGLGGDRVRMQANEQTARCEHKRVCVCTTETSTSAVPTETGNIHLSHGSQFIHEGSGDGGVTASVSV